MAIYFVRNSAANCGDGVHVLHLGANAKLIGSLGTDGEVHVAAHGAKLHAALRHLRETQQRTQALKVCNNLVGAGEVRLADDLDQRHARTVEVDQRGVGQRVVNELAGIFLHVDLLDADVLRAVLGLDANGAVHSHRREPLGGLVRARQVGIVVALLVEGSGAVDVAVQHHASGHAQVNRALVGDGKHAGHTAASRAYVAVLLVTRAIRARAEDLGIGGQLYMNLEANDGFVTH